MLLLRLMLQCDEGGERHWHIAQTRDAIITDCKEEGQELRSFSITESIEKYTDLAAAGSPTFILRSLFFAALGLLETNTRRLSQA